jgi:hypothetical protein
MIDDATKKKIRKLISVFEYENEEDVITVAIDLLYQKERNENISLKPIVEETIEY